VSEDEVRELALEASEYLLLGLPFFAEFGDVGLGVGVTAAPGERHHVERVVQLTVPAAIESMSLCLS
jgi:hypothetical protein